MICYRKQLLVTKLGHKRRGLERLQKMPDPRQKAPQLEKDIQTYSQDIASLVSMLLKAVLAAEHPCAFPLSFMDPKQWKLSGLFVCMSNC